MTELQGKKQKQPSSRPEGWPTAMVVQLELTCRQQRYAKRVGIARFVYNRLVANDQAARRPSGSPHTSSEGIQHRQADQRLTGLRDPGQQVRRPRRLPQLPQRPLHPQLDVFRSSCPLTGGQPRPYDHISKWPGGVRHHPRPWRHLREQVMHCTTRRPAPDRGGSFVFPQRTQPLRERGRSTVWWSVSGPLQVRRMEIQRYTTWRCPHGQETHRPQSPTRRPSGAAGPRLRQPSRGGGGGVPQPPEEAPRPPNEAEQQGWVCFGPWPGSPTPWFSQPGSPHPSLCRKKTI